MIAEWPSRDDGHDDGDGGVITTQMLMTRPSAALLCVRPADRRRRDEWVSE